MRTRTAARRAAPVRAGPDLCRSPPMRSKKKKADTTAAPRRARASFPSTPRSWCGQARPTSRACTGWIILPARRSTTLPQPIAKPKATWMDRLAGGQSEDRKIQSQDVSLPTDRALRHCHRFQGPGVRGRSKSRSRVYLQHRNPRYPAHPQRLRSPLRLDQRPRHRRRRSAFCLRRQDAPRHDLQSQARGGRPDHGGTG